MPILTDKPDGSVRRRRSAATPLEILTASHVSMYIVLSSWAFGGQAGWVRGSLTAFGSLSLFITFAAILRGELNRSPRLWYCFIPILLFDVIVLLASRNPTFRSFHIGTDDVWGFVGGNSNGPGSAVPQLARTALWEYNAIWLSTFNLALIIRRRRLIRTVLLAIVVNALALAIFGAAQKLAHSTGIYFNRVRSPQEYFFSSFVYHNHWSAFTLLMLSACIGLITHYGRQSAPRGQLHSPAILCGAIALLLAVTIPLSASRSSTVLASVVLVAAILHWLATQVARRRRYRESVVPPLTAAFCALGFAGAATWYVAGDTIAARTKLTMAQIQEAKRAQAEHQLNSRLQLYRDTWEMARARPWFGWGMASYPVAFALYNSRWVDHRLPVFYHDAHNDWLQSLAEHGFIGTGVLVGAALVPLLLYRRWLFSSAVSGYLLFGCLIIAMYAALEFPFGNYAVVLTWWTCFFAGLQYGRMSQEKMAS